VRTHRAAKRPWVQWAVFGLAQLVLVLAYLVLLRLAFTAWGIDETATGNRRDNLFLLIHGAFIAGAAVVGFAAGKWLNGLGVAFAVLFLSVMVVAQLGTIAGSQALACTADRNNLIRHWSC
jgi:hypothetical protein